MKAAKKRKGSEPVWLVTQLRATAFPFDLADIGKELDWEALVGEAPQSVEQQPRLKTKVSRGPFAAGQLICSSYPDRIELIYAANVDDAALQSGDFPHLGVFEPILADFQPLICKWLEGLPPIKRIAFGPGLIIPVGNHVEAYKMLNVLLPSVDLNPDTSDFSYQINRTRASTVIPTIRINRLTKWNALRAGALIHTTTGEVISIAEKFACRLEIDVNTQHGLESQLPKDSLLTLFGELVELSIEISKKGDIP